jgi:ADP-heptose:LPS heptosyltransferase
MRILFVTANRVGDAVLTTGVLDHLIHQHPHCRVTVACGPPAEGVFARMPNLEHLMVFAKKPWRTHWLGLWREVAFTRWDLVVDLRGSALAWLVPTRRRVVMRRAQGLMYVQFARLLGIDPPPLPVAWTGPQDRARADALLPPGRPVIGLGPTANWAPKMWPAERFAALFHRLASERLPRAVPLILAGPGPVEQAMAAPLKALLPEAVDTTGLLSLPEAAACLARCAVFVGNDSGLMHLAAASGAPTVGLCAATRDRAAEYEPAGPRARWAMGRGDDMEHLDVETALAAVLDVLARAAEPA